MADLPLIPDSRHSHQYMHISEFPGRQYGGGNSKRKTLKGPKKQKSKDAKDDRPRPLTPEFSSIALLTGDEKDFDKTQWERTEWFVESGSDISQGSQAAQNSIMATTSVRRKQGRIRRSQGPAKTKNGCQLGVFVIFFCEFLLLGVLDIVLWFSIADHLNHNLAAIAIAVAAICPFCASSIEICRRNKNLGNGWTRAQVMLQIGFILLGLTGCILLFVSV